MAIANILLGLGGVTAVFEVTGVIFDSSGDTIWQYNSANNPLDAGQMGTISPNNLLGHEFLRIRQSASALTIFFAGDTRSLTAFQSLTNSSGGTKILRSQFSEGYGSTTDTTTYTSSSGLLLFPDFATEPQQSFYI